MSALRLAAAAMAAAVLVAPARAGVPQLIPANDARISWVGRRLPVGSGSYAIDWEGTAATITIANATTVGVQITDGSAQGGKFAVYVNNIYQGKAPGDAMPNLKALMFLSAPGVPLYPIARGGTIQGETVTYTVQLLTEPNFVQDFADNQTLVIDGFVTDGVVVTPVPPATAPRRVEFLGDSLTAGYGSGFDLPPGAVACGGGNLIDDWSNDYSALLCANFSAECATEAVSGITLMVGQPNLPQLWDYTLGSMYAHWATKTPYNYSSFIPDAVVINLGENDWNGSCGTKPGCVAQFTAAYVAFVTHIATSYDALPGGSNNITFFAAIAPHEKGQSVGILPAVATLQQSGFNAVFLNATVSDPSLPSGCGGHPGPSIHKAAFERARPVIAAAMGWD